MEKALSDEYLVRCITPTRAGKVKPVKSAVTAGGLPSIFHTKMNRSDPRAVTAMAKYAERRHIPANIGKRLSRTIKSSPATQHAEAAVDSGSVQIRSTKSARLLATAIYYALKPPGSMGDLTRDDVERALGEPCSSDNVSAQAWALLTRGRGGSEMAGDVESVNLKQVKEVVSNVYATRDNLAKSLKGANSIAKDLAACVVGGLRFLTVFAVLWICDLEINSE